ncbi:MAG: ATP-binding cassette domain-containing protein [Faecalibacterium prausnitzii]
MLALIGLNARANPPCSKHWRGSWPLGGAVLLDGQELARIPGNARAQKLALMLPHTRRTELTTCFEFAAAGRILHRAVGHPFRRGQKQIQNSLELVGAAHLANRDFNCVSDGQRQRILLARAVCQQPQVLLLDEPTSFLDVKGKIRATDHFAKAGA